MSKRTMKLAGVAALALAASWLVLAAAMAQTAPTPAPPPAASAAPAAPDAEIVDLACTVAKGGICRPGEDCKPTDRVGEEPLPLKITIDFDNRVVMSPVSKDYVSSSRIALLAHDEDQLMLHGIEHGFAWLMSVHEKTRAFSLTVTSARGVFAGFGTCVPVGDLQAKKKN